VLAGTNHKDQTLLVVKREGRFDSALGLTENVVAEKVGNI
jgi:hypothetical protein